MLAVESVTLAPLSNVTSMAEFALTDSLKVAVIVISAFFP